MHAARIFATVLLTLASLSYPLIWYIGREQGWFTYLAAAMCILWAMRACMQKAREQKVVSLLVAAFFAVVLVLRMPQSMYWYPVWVNILMLILFGSSLFAKQTLIERLARLQHPDLPPQGIVYTRRITQIWCVYFIINGIIAAALAVADKHDWWALYTGIIAYIIMGILGGGEWLYRKLILKL